MMTTPVRYEMRPYQTAMLDAVHRELTVNGLNRVILRAATGTGKTVTFANLLQHGGLQSWLEQFPAGERRVMIIAHREELLHQAAEKIRAVNPGLMVSIEQGDLVASRYSDVVVASIQTLAARDFKRLHKLMAQMTFRVVVVDECHHAAARTYREALSVLGFLPSTAADLDDAKLDDAARVQAIEARLTEWDTTAPRDRVLIGVTATPNRSDAVGLSCVFQSIAFSYGMKDAISDGWLVPLKTYAVATDTNLDNVRTTAGEFNQRDLSETVNTPRRNAEAVAAWKAHADGRPTIGFTVTVEHAHDAAAMFERAGYRAAAVSGETPREDRRALLESFQAGRLDLLMNCMVLTEGTDLPRASAILHMKPTKSATLYEQMTGRGLRLFPGKDDCVVIDMVDLSQKHSLQAAPMLYGLPPMIDAEGKDLREVETMVNALREQYSGADLDELLREVMNVEGLKKLLSVDVWSVEPLPDGIARNTSLDWLKTGEILRLSYPWNEGNETLTVQRDMLGHWDVVTSFKPRMSNDVRQRTIVAGVKALHEAAMRAEEYVNDQRASVLTMKRRDAGWKGRGASPRQINLLRKLKVPIKPGLSAGEASTLIDMALSRKGPRR